MEAIHETFRIATEAGIAAHISHYKIAGKSNWGKSIDTLKLFAQARADGLLIACDQYPYQAGSLAAPHSGTGTRRICRKIEGTRSSSSDSRRN